MDFFQSQDRARRNTGLLLGLYFAAVISIVLLMNVLVFFLAGFQDSYIAATQQVAYDWQVFVGVSVVVIALVGLGSLYRIHSLSQGGQSVAEMLDGALLVDAQGDIRKRQLLNIVEEMAIASGTPVPPVYLIPDQAINAFAAGYSPGDAVIGITQGALENLNRDQLQGVVAHEFSHILNGDMRLNIRLMGVLYGILLLAVVGRIILFSARGGRSSKRDNGAAWVLAIGLGMFALGYVGKLFGTLIKAAVSRQREFLADASAVQFTRHPAGISGALKRIGGYEQGSILQNPESEEMSHAFFCGGVSFAFGALTSTHPPLAERIKRLEPEWSGDYLSENVPESSASRGKQGVATSSAVGGLVAGFGAQSQHSAGQKIDAEHVLNTMGHPDATQLNLARQLIAAIPDALAVAAREPYSARAVVYLLLLDADAKIRDQQLTHLAAIADGNVMQCLQAMLPLRDQLVPAVRLPLLELTMPALRQLTQGQYVVFKDNIDALIRADQKMSLSEWALQKFVSKHLGEAFDRYQRRAGKKTLSAVREHCSMLLSMLAYSDATSSTEPDVVFAKGRYQLDIEVSLLPRESMSLEALNVSVDALTDLRPLLKPRLLKACITTITADGIATPVEIELVRTVADTLDCPMPPISF
ncbi:MAG: Zn-dependent protease with chaperone function [Candidatus Azotimanducaceae bacterium]